MKRTTSLSIVLACGFLTAGTPAFAQSAATVTPAARDWFTGKAAVLLLGRDNVDSSKYEEYRVVPKGLSVPVFTLQGSRNDNAWALFGQNVSQTDQRYSGYGNTGWLGVSFDYNQIPHKMGNQGQSVLTNTAPGVWSMSSTLRAALGTAIDTTMPTTARTYPFYANLFAPIIASASRVDLDGLRQRGSVEVDLGSKLPFDLTMTYMRDVRTGTRGAGGGAIASGFGSFLIEVPEPLNQVTQDAGFKFAVNGTWGNVHAAFNHNWYNDRQETLLIDNPHRPFDLLYTAAVGTTVPPLGGPGTARFINPPDNAANMGSGGVLLKLAKQTRISADVAMGRWTQNAQLYPYTSNSAILTPAGVRADSVAALQVQSANGEINTQSINLGISTRPVDALGLRMRYRTYDVNNDTPGFVRTGSTGNNVDRNWSVAPAPTAADPFGYATANPYGSKSKRFDLQASYDVNQLTLEGAYRNTQLERTYREATKGAENGGSIAAVVHSGDMLLFRGVFEKANRTASGYDAATSLGLQADESERDTTKGGFDLDLTPNDKVGFVLAYARRNDDYPNRPNRIANVANTATGLLSAKYDTYTAEVDLTPSERADLSVYYTYEKNLSTTRIGGAAAAPYAVTSAQLKFEGSDKTDTFGVNANLVLVPEQYASGAGKWTCNVTARRQKLDGLMAITGDPTGAYALGRVYFGGIKNIDDYDDTELTTATAELDYTVAASWSLAFGYKYEKYDFADAYTDGTEVFPITGSFYLKANDGPYKVNAVYARVNVRF